MVFSGVSSEISSRGLPHPSEDWEHRVFPNKRRPWTLLGDPVPETYTSLGPVDLNPGKTAVAQRNRQGKRDASRFAKQGMIIDQ